MKLNSYILTLLGAAALTSCSAVYEDLEPCPTGADVRLTYCNNMQATDLYDTHVHCAKLLLYNAEGKFVSEYDYTAAPTLSLDLPVGHYYAIAYGGMTCEDASYQFGSNLEQNHHYTTLETYLKGSRAVIADKLHTHFHGFGEFTISDTDLAHISTTIDLT
ncbi:MAG: FimB/Mfa2 family fimbrial subunit, partial [Muribaculaceae bacterium]|nr:FimB/Mfa2 family fimbrial subunit [Muribaculaceae bacterium]